MTQAHETRRRHPRRGVRFNLGQDGAMTAIDSLALAP